MPFSPELFSASVLEGLQERRQHELVRVPYFDGLMAGEPEALVGSFAAAPELHDPVRGRVKGTRNFRTFVSEASSWLRRHHVSVQDVGHVIAERGGFEEVILHFDAQNGRVALPAVIVADLSSDGRIEELRVYFSTLPLAGRHTHRPPLLQPDPELREPEVVRNYQGALAAGDIDGVLAAFESDGYVQEPAGARHFHGDPDALREFYELQLSRGGGIAREHCAVIDDGSSCALEYNLVRWGSTEIPPQAGVAVYVGGQSGKLAAARIYDDTDPSLGLAT